METNMKIHQYIRNARTLLLVLCIVFCFSCNDEEFLNEVPLDFYAPVNSYISYENFEASIYNMYNTFRAEFYQTRNVFHSPRVTMTCTDMITYDQNSADFPDLLNPHSDWVYTAFWQPCYQIIFDANVIIGRSDAEIAELTEEQKAEVVQALADSWAGFKDAKVNR